VDGERRKVVYEALAVSRDGGCWKTLDGYSAKEIDHAGTYVMFLKSLLSSAEIQVWVPQEEKWWEHFQLSTAFYEPKCI
jgi:hypothetical protein